MIAQKLIVALGNPGSEYANTRHNAGWKFLDTIYPDLVWFKAGSALVADFGLESVKVYALKPQTFMNLSGRAVKSFWTKNLSEQIISPENLLVIHDEVDFPFGTWKWQANRSAAGHNGIKSLIEEMGTQNFSRLRLGVGQPGNSQSLEDYVLEPFKAEELASWPSFFGPEIKTIIETWIKT